ncbi:MAG: hypothetical protein WDO56_18530 [Gammaproteobacteria bacterium]
MNDARPQLLYDALDVLDRYSAKLGNRDPVKSLNEDQNELLRRVRAALEVLISKDDRRSDVADIAKRIDAVLAPAPPVARIVKQGANRIRNTVCSPE